MQASTVPYRRLVRSAHSHPDYRHRAAAEVTSPKASATSLPLFSPPELKAMIDAAHALGVKVASHATNPSTISHLIRAGVDTIEHGTGLDCSTLHLFKDNPNAIWNPTLSVLHTMNIPTHSLEVAIKDAFTTGIPKIACGGDTGVFSHGDNALEMKLINRCGVNWKEVVKAATWTGWLCVRSSWWDSEAGKAELARYKDGSWAAEQECRTSDDEVGNNDLGENEVAVGAIKIGFGADLVATSGGLEKDFESAVDKSSIVFVMKAGVVHKWHREEPL
jgi:imidazolonepropionase-like amidohydrolase